MFSIKAFDLDSTEAAVASGTSTASAVDLPQGVFDVDSGGQATYRIPIEVPPGVAGLQPALELTYAHRQGNGILGVGWALGGFSAIGRIKPTYAIDGFNGAVSYGANDRYALDGVRLINVRGTYGGAGTLYNTEIQSWNAVLAGPTPDDGFTVTAKNGDVREYGKTADSRILADGTNLVRQWGLNASVDLNGNRVEYVYTERPLLTDGTRGAGDPGSSFVDAIRYTVRDGLEATRSVRFVYDDRRAIDPIVSYVGGYEVAISYRLARIDTYVGDEIARSYAFTYQTSAATNRSCLAAVIESGAGGTGTLRPTTVTWQDDEEPGFSIGPASQLDQHLGSDVIHTMDVNGDGRTDVVQLWLDHDGALNATTYLATPESGEIRFERSSNSVLGNFPQPNVIYPADVDGDGRTDLLVAYKSGQGTLKLAVALSNGTGFDDPTIFDTGDPWLDAKHIDFFAMDANGDGRTDFVEAYAHHDPQLGDVLAFRSYLSLFGDGSGATFTAAITTTTSDPAFPPAQLALWPMDVNGDGMMDMVRVWQRGSDSHVVVGAYLAVSTSLDAVSFASDPVLSDLGVLNLADQIAFLPTDTNGDGIGDLLQVWQEPRGGSTTLHLTTFFSDAAGGFVAGPDSAFADQTLNGSFYPMDFNGGGMTAVVSKWISGANELMFSTFLASASGAYRTGPTLDAGDAGSQIARAVFSPCDVNGDGKADLLAIIPGSHDDFLVRPYTSAGAYPDLATAIENPLGGRTTIAYLPLSDASVYHGTNDSPNAFPKAAARRYPNPITPTQFPVQSVVGQAIYVVSRYANVNDPAVNRFSYGDTYTMRYTEARINLLGRGWECFASTTKLSEGSGLTTRTEYNQDFPYTGLVSAVRLSANGSYTTDPRVPTDDDDVLLNLATNAYAVVQRGAGVDGTAIVEVLRTVARSEYYDYGADHFDYALAHTYAYDDFGNVAIDVDLGYVGRADNDPLSPDEVVYRYNRYQNDVEAGRWQLGYLRYAKVSANAVDRDITAFLPGDLHLDAQTYDARYNLATAAKWDDVHDAYLTTAYAYDDFGNRTAETKPGGAVTGYDYDPTYHTYVMRVTSPPNDDGEHLVTTIGYDPRFGVEVARCTPNGAITTVGLDPFGRKALHQGPVPAGTENDPNAVTTLVTGSDAVRRAFLSATVVTLQRTSYDQDDRNAGAGATTLALQRFPLDGRRDELRTQRFVDGLGRTRESVQESGQSAGDAVVLTDYDAQGKPTREGLPFFSPTVVVTSSPFAIVTRYDVLSRPISRAIPAGADGETSSTTTWSYGMGGVVTQTSGAGSATEYVQVIDHHWFDGKDCVRSITVPADADATTAFTFDRIARLLVAVDPATVTNPDGVPNTSTYDSLDRKSTFDNADENTTGDANVKALTYTYDPSTGLLQMQTDASGAAIAMRYDALGRVTGKALPDGRTCVLEYDDAASNGAGKLSRASVTDRTGTLESRYVIGYDLYGNTTSLALTIAGEGDPFVTVTAYDPQHRVVGQTFPDGTALERRYAFGRMIAQMLAGARVDYPLDDYTALGKAGTVVYGAGVLPGNGVVTGYTFNPAGRLYGETVDGSAARILDLSYGYDLLDQLLAIEDLGGSANAQRFSYANKRLVTADVPGFAPSAYAYDASGNMLGKDGVTYTYRAHYPVRGVNGGVVFEATPDACGRTAKRRAADVELTFAYDGLGSLRSVTAADGTVVRAMLSDYLGRCIRQVDADQTRRIFCGPAYQLTIGPSGERSATKYILDDRGVAAQITGDVGATVLYLRPDHKQSTTIVFGDDGMPASRYVYAGYGAMRLADGSASVDRTYERRRWDEAIGLYMFGARYYDPSTGRYLTPDTQAGASNLLQTDILNRFAFELNSPVNNVDPDGHSASAWGGIAIGVALLLIGIGIAVLTAGTASPIVAGMFIGAFVAAGATAVGYSATHYNNFSWADFGKQTAIAFGVGAITGGAMAWGGTGAMWITTALRTGIISSLGDTSTQLFTNLAMGDDWKQGLKYSAIIGFAFGAVGGAVGFRLAKQSEAALDDLNPRNLHARAVTNYQSLDPEVHDLGAFSSIKDSLRTTALKTAAKTIAIQSFVSNLAVVPEVSIEAYEA